jgi:hypothetical protein
VLAVAGIWKMESSSAPQLRAYVAGLAAMSLLVLTAIDAANVHRFMDRHLSQLPRVANLAPKALIVNTAGGYYAADLVQNDPFLRTRPLVLISHGASADGAAMKNNFPGLHGVHAGYRGTVWTDSPP